MLLWKNRSPCTAKESLRKEEKGESTYQVLLYYKARNSEVETQEETQRLMQNLRKPGADQVCMENWSLMKQHNKPAGLKNERFRPGTVTRACNPRTVGG